MSAIREHEFTLTLRGVFASHSGDLADRLYEAGCDDALFSTAGGRAFLDFTREAPTMRDALVAAIRDVRAAGCEVDRVATSDLVTRADIARRLGRSRQRASQWTSAEAEAKGFPPPACRSAEGHSLWSWREVARWAYEHGLAEAEVWQAAEDVDLINSILAYRHYSRSSGEAFRKLLEAIDGADGRDEPVGHAAGRPD